MDGSLGILYWIGNMPYISTRGFFLSDQALVGTRILNKKFAHLFEHFNKEVVNNFLIKCNHFVPAC
jgi:hypothetical protein